MTRVAVAVVLRRGFDGGAWILISHRMPAGHLPDLWEFPGGKCEPGESGADCARREVEEETGVLVAVHSLLLERPYAYAEVEVVLEFHLCKYLRGTPEPRECQAARWVRPENLESYPFPLANEPVLEVLRQGGWLEAGGPRD